MNTAGWKFQFAFRGYKPGEEPGKSGSTRVVWKYGNLWIVLKLFDDKGNFPEYPRTLKFWYTKEFKKDRMEWTSSANAFTPTEAEFAAYNKALDPLLDAVEESLY